MTADMPPAGPLPALDQHISAAQPGAPGQPDRAEPSEPRSGALDRPAKRSYPTDWQRTSVWPTINPNPMTDPETGCVEHARNSEKDSDTPQPVFFQRSAAR